MNDVHHPTDEPSVSTGPVEHRSGLWRSRTASLLVVVLCLGALGGLGWYLAHRNATRQPADAEGRRRPTATVAFAVANRADIPIRLDALGTVTPVAMATVRPQVAGVITKIYYQEGQLV